MASKTHPQLLRSEELELTVMLDRRIADMRRLLAVMRPGSSAAALRALRDAFPEASLEERVRALTVVRH
jgi:hypothetical protein